MVNYSFRNTAKTLPMTFIIDDRGNSDTVGLVRSLRNVFELGDKAT